uniref:NFACT RNA-binding domain-containing protein n=1 Tax=Grammatophora oceanica TaxID=210454 RepID=A0A7S1YNJ4_9STRA|mmetsp:Transcript_9351/g.13723  ORF Transcript_9351/g.13723 Transcript_9351/m.13723 type:complete len:181 (+) Transcript_9351:3-545(+)
MKTFVRKLLSPAGSTVYVGRNQRGNEHLSMQFARGNDVWMHARGCPGAHVIIQNRRGSSPVTQECMEFAANLAIFYSDARNEVAFDVSVAEPKHVLKPRGAGLGAVKLREEKQVLTGRPALIPEELKLARGESGQSDEYHTTDKAKHRRRNKEAAKQVRSKKRAEIKEKRKRKRNSATSD